MIRILALIFLTLTLGAVIHFGLISNEALPDHPLIRGKNDLVLHVVAFGALMITLSPLMRLWLAAVATAFAAFAVEAIQIMIPGRTASLSDILAGFLGIFIAGLIIWMVRTFTAHRRRRLYDG